jgi:hypothetical protein
MASRNELGWFAAIKTGPFMFIMALFCMRKPGQNMAKAKRIKGFSK